MDDKRSVRYVTNHSITGKKRFAGSESINKASRQRKNHHIHTVPGQSVHKECRLVYCNSNKIAQAGRHDLQDTQGTQSPVTIGRAGFHVQ